MNKQIEKMVSDYAFNHNIYMMDEYSKLTEKDISRMETNIICALLMDLGYEYKDGIWKLEQKIILENILGKKND